MIVLIAALFAAATPAAADCVYPPIPLISDPAQPAQDGMVDAQLIVFGGDAVGGNFVYQAGCVIVDPPPPSPPCSPYGASDDDCPLPPLPPPLVNPEPRHHDTTGKCGKQSAEGSRQERKTRCGVHRAVSFNIDMALQSNPA